MQQGESLFLLIVVIASTLDVIECLPSNRRKLKRTATDSAILDN